MQIVETLTESIAKEVGDMEDAKKIVRRITRDFGGEQIYIPQERYAFRLEIEEELYKDFDGANLREVAKKYGVSNSSAREIIKRVRKRHAAAAEASQGRLF